jgi:ParB-like chromosome segregation protein Spo0J
MKTKKLLEASHRQWMATGRIKTASPFKDLFPVDEKKVDAIAEHIKANGYDEAQPIILWDATKGRGPHDNFVVDGHTRLLAAKKLKLSPVYVARVKFSSEEEALQYAIHNQRDRRNLTDSVLLRCIEAVDKMKQRGGDRKSQKSIAPSEAIEKGKSAEETAKVVGTSRAKVEKARRVSRDPEGKQAVIEGKKSLNQAYSEIKGASPVIGAEPKVATWIKAHCVCPYCGKKIYEDQIKLMRVPDEEQHEVMH